MNPKISTTLLALIMAFLLSSCGDEKKSAGPGNNSPGLEIQDDPWAKAVSTGSQHTCAILNDDSLVCWGANSSSQLGDGSTTDRNTPVGVNLEDGMTAVALSAGKTHTCAILNDDSLVCWGGNGNSQLGDGSNTKRNTPVSVDLGDGMTAVAVSAGETHTCAILNDDSLKCWGDNTSGRLGDGSTTSRLTPVSVDLGDGVTAKALSAGGTHTCAILNDDSLVCWGFNFFGQLGDGSTTDRNTPVEVNLGDGVSAKAVGAGSHHTCAILNDDSLVCWGANGSGQLGDGSTTDRSTPVGVNLGDGVSAVALSTGSNHTCAILNDGSPLCWGANGNGRLGDGSSTGRSTPVGVNLEDGGERCGGQCWRLSHLRHSQRRFSCVLGVEWEWSIGR